MTRDAMGNQNVDQLPLWLVDFAQALQDDPAGALEAVQLLLLDEWQCRRRVALLRRLDSQEERPDPRYDFARDCRTIGEFGVIDAVRGERITIERLLALVGDPDALWAAHRALGEPPRSSETMPDAAQSLAGASGYSGGRSLAGASGYSSPASLTDETVRDEPAHKQATAGTFTALARRGDWPRLAEKLRPYLPVLLSRLGLELTLADRLLDWIRAELPRLGDRPFRDSVSEWVREFVRRETGRTVELGRDDWLAAVEQTKVSEVVRSIPDTAALWARRWRDTVLKRPATMLDDLLQIDLPESSANVPLLPDFRREVFVQARSRMAGAIEELEL